MFTLTDMQHLLRAKPFVPFRLWLSDGGSITVRSPELVFPGRRYAIVGLLDPNTLEDAYDRHMAVWYMHVTRCEELTPGSSPLALSGESPPDTPTPANQS